MTFADVWQATHIAVHGLIFCGYVMAMILVPRVLGNLMRISPATSIAGAGFFVFCGITHIALALGQSDGWFVTLTDHLQAGCILVFVICMTMDFTRVAARLHAAYIAIGVKYGEEQSREIIATMRAALEGPG